MGRKKIEETVGLDRILKAYQVHKSIYGTARALCIAPNTLKRVLRDNNIEMYKDRIVTVNYHRTDGNRSKFALWLKEHPDARLPKNMKEIARRTGLSYDTIRGYFKRRRSATTSILKSLPSLREVDVVLEDTLGRHVRSEDIRTYQYTFDKYSMRVGLRLHLKDGTVTDCHIENLQEFSNSLNRGKL